ncbi:MAG: hypothetical protein HRT73_05520, partial [Flavobacteriales bacterium]|nr:hypothetical protein [Flavobacteriales bacterium]
KNIDYVFNTKLQTYQNLASRNLERELFFSKNGKLHYLIFTPPSISFFLKDYSIRSIVQLNKEEVIVTTETNGWFLVDLKTAKVKNFKLKKNNKPYRARLNRSLMKDTNGYWGNDNFGIIYIDKETYNVTSYSNTKKSFTLVQDSFSIYYTTYDFDIMQFDKRTKKNHLLIAADSLDFQDIIKRGESLYLVSDKGLSHYKNGVLNLYKPKNKEDVFLMSLDDNKTHGLLAGSLSGKLFRFNTETHTFELLYQDKLEASIASILVDDAKNIWINTFAGTVSFNPKDKSTTRYTTSDGLSHNEANRHSAAKTKEGSFLIGTLKGLNYFHPDSLSQVSTDASLKFASLHYFNPKLEAFRTIESPVELAKIKNIILPSNNRTLIAHFGVLGSFLNNDVNYRYRLDSQNWINLGNTHELQLINLAPGSYGLEIEAFDATKNKIGDSLVLAILSKEVFYKTWWFILAVVIVILSIILIYSKKANDTKLTELKNKLLKVEIKQKHNDLTDFAMNISRNQIWGKQILEKIRAIRNSRERGRAKGKEFDLLEAEIKNRMLIGDQSLDYQKQVNDLNYEFYETLIQTYPGLSKTEVKLCALLRLDLSNNEIAVLQNIALESVYKSRSRIRKKLNLPSDTDLNMLLKGF